MNDKKLNLLIAARELELNRELESALKEMSQSYSIYEMDSWSTQLREANEFLKDNTAVVPFISGIAQARGITVKELSEKIIAKAESYNQELSGMLGKKQARQDALYKIKSSESLSDQEIIDAINNV